MTIIDSLFFQNKVEFFPWSRKKYTRFICWKDFPTVYNRVSCPTRNLCARGECLANFKLDEPYHFPSSIRQFYQKN